MDQMVRKWYAMTLHVIANRSAEFLFSMYTFNFAFFDDFKFARSADNSCHQTFWSADSKISGDNRLSLAKCLVTTGCQQQKVC